MAEKKAKTVKNVKKSNPRWTPAYEVDPEVPKYGRIHMFPLDNVDGFDIRPGFYDLMGATAIPCGVNFTISSNQATSIELLLFKRDEQQPYAVIPFPKNYRIGNVYSMIVFDLDIEDFEYAYRVDGPNDPKRGLIFDKTKILLDPYAKAVAGQHDWGRAQRGDYHARVVKNNFDWGNSEMPLTPMEDLIIYEMHVRGFTKDESSGVTKGKNGTFEGVQEKIPYLKDLGVTAVELMPIFEFDEILGRRDFYGRELMDYWGYNTVSFFAPNTSYASKREHNREGSQLKSLIKAFHDNGIEVFLDVVFNHTAEGNENGPYISFKGLDNNIYYMMTPDGYYYNFSGCGNTLNCNHPIVQKMIRDCLRYWVTAYRVDGFRFDLATILGRNEDGSPMSEPPLLQSLAFDAILGRVKLIAEAWDAGGLYQVGSFPSWNRWAEWNGRYRDDMRSFLKGDNGKARAAANRIMGSPDLYNGDARTYNASVNFLVCHDGFTLHDLYVYNVKHNEENNWGNTDGSDDNLSWNCGVEGETSDPDVRFLRRRMMRNAMTALLLSRGTPMFYMGDEFGNSQGGNNNAYCQDNYISWLDWEKLKLNIKFHDHVKDMIAFRKKHIAIRRECEPCSLQFPTMSVHGVNPWNTDFNDDSHYVGVMFAGRNPNGRGDDIVYVAFNTYWEDLEIRLPELSRESGLQWVIAIDTFEEDSLIKGKKIAPPSVLIRQRSIMAFTAVPLK